MNAIPFTKMSAAGNDFIIIDNRQHILDAKPGKEWAQTICRRKLSVGADGLILIEEDLLIIVKLLFLLTQLDTYLH